MPIGFWAISRQDIAERYQELYGEKIDRELLDSIIRNLRHILDKALEDYILPRFSGVKS